MPDLIVLAADGTERRVSLGEAVVVFGRDETCDVVLDEQRASRRHCEIRRDGDGWRVVDLGSSNGTFLGGQPVLAARLLPGDEIEIGSTLLVFEDAAAPPAAVRPRRARRLHRKPQWGLLAVPAVCVALVWFLLGSVRARAAASREATWTEFAQATLKRTALMPADRAGADRREAAVAAARALLPNGEEGDRARRILDEGGGDAAPVRGAADDAVWRAALSEVRGGWDAAPPTDLRMRLAALLERHGDDDAARSEIDRLLVRLQEDVVRRDATDRAAVASEADRAVSESRFGDAIDAWDGWVARAPSMSATAEREVGAAYEEISQAAEEAAQRIAEQVRALHAESRADAAGELIDNGLERLRGTGWGEWLLASVAELHVSSGPEMMAIGKSGGSATTRARVSVRRALSTADGMVRQRRFRDAAEHLEAAVAGITDADLLDVLTSRAADLREEQRVLGKMLGQVREEPSRFSPLRLPDGTWKVNGATGDGLLLEKGDDAGVRTFDELPSEALSLLHESARLDDGDHVGAALLLFDVGETAAYVRAMRAALSISDDLQRNAASEVHGRLTGHGLPSGGYVPHPSDETAIITYDEAQAIENAARIVVMTKDLEKLVARIEGTKQAKSIDKVRRAFAKLEEARDHALLLIFDEVKYFYPYRDRMQEYMPVKLEVDERVQAVREAWDSSARARPKRDREIEGLLDKAETMLIDFEFIGGDGGEFGRRVENVSRYLDRDLTVQNWFVSDADLELLEYNDGVMANNREVESVATDPERRQVEITNEYRIMFGHRHAVRINDQLTLAARGHSEDMSRIGFFAHESPVEGKRHPQDRVRAAGYPLWGCSENIHMGSGEPLGAHKSWIGSSGHHRNILSKDWREMGTGRSGVYWTQNFGFRE